MNILEQIESVSPGEILRNKLKEICSFNALEEDKYVSKFDEILLADGELSRLVYESTLNYLLRRLITAAVYIRKAYFDTTDDEKVYWEELRKFVNEKTQLPAEHREQIVTLLHFCVLENIRQPNKGTKRKVRQEAKENNAKCYICGRDVLHDRVKPEDDIRKENAEIEHKWPKSLGGSNKFWNLVVACNRCNELKENYLDPSDFHYEHLCAVTDENMDKFGTDFNWKYRIPVLAKSEFRCSIEDCQNEAKNYGSLKFARIDSQDSWHFLNINAYCDEHFKGG